ncbi:MAG: Enterochelin esterase, partial [Edaphobacter sp.]|nr:Enterochelin esterase [Edaphobacter sp.]
MGMNRVLLSALLVMSLPLVAQQPAAKPAQQPGGPNSGPAPAPPPLSGDALQRPGVPAGKLSERLMLKSQIYDGMVSEYWIYVP